MRVTIGASLRYGNSWPLGPITGPKKRPKAKTVRIEYAPHDLLSSVHMWCAGSTAPLLRLHDESHRRHCQRLIRIDPGRSRRNNPPRNETIFRTARRTAETNAGYALLYQMREPAHVDARESILPRLLPCTSVRDAQVRSRPLRVSNTGRRVGAVLLSASHDHRCEALTCIRKHGTGLTSK